MSIPLVVSGGDNSDFIEFSRLRIFRRIQHAIDDISTG